jgi:GTPase SAR1 family protein
LQSYIAHSDAVLLIYDVTNPESFSNLEDWLNQVKKYYKTDAKIYLVGNKVDLISQRQVSESNHEKFIRLNNLDGGLYVSAKTGENVVKAFYKIAAEAVGIRLSEYELSFHDKVLVAHVSRDTTDVASDVDESRQAWAREIEREDLEAERKKKAREAKKGDRSCSVS